MRQSRIWVVLKGTVYISTRLQNPSQLKLCCGGYTCLMMKMFFVVLLACIACANSQHSLGHYLKHGGHKYHDSAHASHGHGHHGALEEVGDEGYAKHGHHAISAHKAYGDKVAHHDSHHKHHDKGYYERNKGYGYEKAYAYDKIKSHHDKGSSQASHGYKHAHHGSEGSHKVADEGSHGYAKYAKKSHHGGHDYANHDKSLGHHGAYHHSYDSRGHQAPVIAHQGYEQVVPIAHTVPLYSGSEHYGYVH